MDTLLEGLEAVERLLSSTNGEAQDLTENATDSSSLPADRQDDPPRAVFGFETDSTWDDFCNDLSLDETICA
jgi:hypothetical protein